MTHTDAATVVFDTPLLFRRHYYALRYCQMLFIACATATLAISPLPRITPPAYTLPAITHYFHVISLPHVHYIIADTLTFTLQYFELLPRHTPYHAAFAATLIFFFAILILRQ